MVRYTKSLPLDDVIAYLQDKDLSQPENREMWVEIIQTDDDFSVSDFKKIVSDFYEIKKEGSTWKRPWVKESDFFGRYCQMLWMLVERIGVLMQRFCVHHRQISPRQ